MSKMKNLFSAPSVAEVSFMIVVVITFLVFRVGNIFAEIATTTGTPAATSTTTNSLASDVVPPSSPVGLYTSNITTSSVTLVWQASIDPEVAGQIRSGLKGYRIFKTNNPTSFINSLVNYYVVTGLEPGTTYGFVVAAYDVTENVSGYSNPISVTLPSNTTGNIASVGTSTSSTGSNNSSTNSGTSEGTSSSSPTSPNPTSNTTLANDTTPPSVPTELFYSNQTPANVTLKWRASVDPDISGQFKSGLLGYRIYRNNETVPIFYSSINSINLPSTILGVTSIFRVSAFDSAGNTSVLSNPISVTISSSTPSSTPSSTTGTNSGTNIITTNTSTTAPIVPPVLPLAPQVTQPPKVTIPPQEKPKETIPKITTQPNTSKSLPTNPVGAENIFPERVPIPPVSKQTFVSPTTTIAIKQLQNITSSIDVIRTSLEENKQKILDVVDGRISKILSEDTLSGTSTKAEVLQLIRKDIANEIDLRLKSTTTITSDTARELESKIADNLKRIEAEIPRLPSGGVVGGTTSLEVESILNNLVKTVEDESKTLKDRGGDLLYKDSNADGISDYESVYVYDIDPIKPSPTTEFEGKKITAGEKVLLGYDPKHKGLVRVIPEEPSVSPVQATPVYKVSDVQLSEKKQVVIKGKALPNSLVTVYIYSTPVIVVVKTNDNGEWEYTLDKELDTGEHKIYTASVNNSGKIVAKSSEFTFVKTAEAATLNPSPSVPLSEIKKPGLINNNNIYLIIGIFLAVVGVSVGLIGMSGKNSVLPEEQNRNF